ncbi:MAG: DMT family transporter [Neisseria sp.]|nr:DMT family transporter [Neisseria sp.]
MHYLIISICCSVSVAILLKLARQNKVEIEQMVGVNYLIAIALTVYFLQPNISDWQAFVPTWWLFAALGILLPSVFVIMGRSVAAAGIVKSDAAQRLSLFLPIIASFVIFGEQLSQGRLIGLVLAFIALICLLFKTSDKASSGAQTALLLLGVWAGYGVIDILFKQLAKSGTAFAGNLLIAFILAGVLMFGYLFYRQTKWTASGIAGGVLLGALNFGNILSYIKAHQAMADNPTLVFAGMNIGVITLGTLAGAVLFKEKISAINAAGVAIAIAAIACLFYWQTLASLFV